MNTPRILIAGTNSGCGKTTLSVGIMAALVRKGLKVQPFKVGPDYIDPMFHTFITGNHSRNLDSWMLDENTVKYLFDKNCTGKDIAVVEGVMGLYDGYGGYSSTGSTAHVAKLINAPVILVINGEGLSLSIAAIIKGFVEFDKGLKIKGIIINNIKSEHHFKLLKEVIEENTGITAIGYMPKIQESSLPSRHLGLIPNGEIDDLNVRIERLACQVEKTIDLELLLKISREVEELNYKSVKIKASKDTIDVNIAVSYDKAFNFYYKDNLDLLEMLGARLKFFSPLSDEKLPDDIDGMYMGGGYPEMWAKELNENTSMIASIRQLIRAGLPTYAECGGLMYMSQSIKDGNGQEYSMAGVIPGESEMTKSLKRFGYVDIELTGDSFLGQKGERIRGHEFHYSVTNVKTGFETCYKVTKSRRNDKNTEWFCGYKAYNLIAGYPHIHFWSNLSFAEKFIDKCRDYRRYRNGAINNES
jgi:cobyrinic acid a,c-diamide synthase